MDKESITLIIKWSGSEYRLENIKQHSTFSQLKENIYNETGVRPERQKLLGLKNKGKPPDDSSLVKELNLKDNSKVMMMGTREEVLAKANEKPADLPEVVDDFDIGEEDIAIEHREEYLAKIEKRIKDFNFEIINEPRKGKKCLVLDIDYTLFDHRSTAEKGVELMRPYLHEFLEKSYQYYDIIIWSATSMKWIKSKLKELGVTDNPNYKICFLMDSLAMITVDAPNYGVIEVKPLGVIWGKFTQWGKHNTIMFDDLRRNFLMNPQTGLKIKPFKEAHFNRDSDKELLKLSKYLKDIASLDDFSSLNHRKWEKYQPRKRSHPET